MNTKAYRVLLIEDDKIDQIAFRKAVEERKLIYNYDIVGAVNEAIEISSKKKYDIVITDYLLGDGTAFDIVDAFKDIPIIITTGAGNEEIAVKAMHRGIQDYLIKDMENNYLKMLPITIENAMSRYKGQKQLRLLSHAIMSISDSVHMTDKEDNIIFINKAFTDTFGYLEKDVKGRHHSMLNKTDDFLDSLQSQNRQNEDTYSNEYQYLNKDGTEFPALISHSVVKDDNGNDVANVWVIRDITEIKEAQSKLHIYATTDVLTGVSNRRAGLLVLEKQLQMCKRNNFKLTLCYIDLNGLKDVNDKLGHQEGDEFILIITNILKDTIREADSVCRLGGDEFLLVFPECGVEDARLIWRRIEEKLDLFNSTNKKPYVVSVSAGFIEYDKDKLNTIEELISEADAEMYKNKMIYKKKMCSDL